jgi:hypothetical protein
MKAWLTKAFDKRRSQNRLLLAHWAEITLDFSGFETLNTSLESTGLFERGRGDWGSVHSGKSCEYITLPSFLERSAAQPRFSLKKMAFYLIQNPKRRKQAGTNDSWALQPI